MQQKRRSRERECMEMESRIFVTWFLGFHLIIFSPSTDGAAKLRCMEIEKEALLAFKSSITDPGDVLSSWGGKDDCCSWHGVRCSNATGHVTKLMLGSDWEVDVAGETLSGEINPALLNLTQLRHLDLSYNDFYGSPFPDLVVSFKNLRYLNLSSTGFGGKIPPQLGNLTRLRYLDLNQLNAYVDDLSWLSRLNSLRYLDFSNMNITGDASHWFDLVNELPSLTYLALPGCGLYTLPASLLTHNLTALATIDLSSNWFNSTLPSWLWNLTSLVNLHLSASQFHGSIPDGIGNLTSLEVLELSGNGLGPSATISMRKLCRLNTLDLSGNKFQTDIADFLYRPSCTHEQMQVVSLESNRFTGNLSPWLERMTSLTLLNLYNNSLGGPIPTGMGKLSQLTTLFLSSNSFEGIVSEAHLANLTSLQRLHLSSNPLTIAIDSEWVPPFQLQDIRLRSCRVGPQFPAWLRWHKEVDHIDLSNASISGKVPDWFWIMSSNVTTTISLSKNHLTGEFPNSVEFTSLEELDLSSNMLEGVFSPQLPAIVYLYLHNNSFSGPLLQKWRTSTLIVLTLSNNNINGEVPSSICNLTGLFLIDLSSNQLSGELPQCWNSESSLGFASFANNNLSGEIPSSIGNLVELRLLRLRNNSLQGPLPPSIQNCTHLTILDLGENRLSGRIPTWIGKSLSSLAVLRLRSNQFFDSIPSNLALIDSLQILDLSRNNISGEIPTSFGNFSGMSTSSPGDVYGALNRELSSSAFLFFTFDGSVAVATKGEELQYTKTVALVKSMDFSSNNLDGKIPEEIVALSGLKNLNLSRNQLSGNIPEKIGGLKSLESLDLSMNELSGVIPQSLTALDFLARLNLSYNNLHGRIPSGNQLQTLDDPYNYVGNAGLCGSPLPKSCARNNTSPSQGTDEEDEAEDEEEQWFYLSMGLGYVVGFWIVCGVLLFKKTWRYAYFRFFDDMSDKVYVAVVVFRNRVARKLASK